MPRGRWAWTDRHLKQKVINPHTQTQRERKAEEGEGQADRANPVQLHFSRSPSTLPTPFWPPSLALCWRPSTHLHKTHPQLGSRRNFSAFLLFPSCFFFHHFCFLRFHIGALRVLVGGRGREVKVEERRWHWGSLRVLFLCRHEN